MKFTILSQYYPPEVGAPQARLSELAKFMQKAGHTVNVLTAMPNYPTGKLFDGYKGLKAIFDAETPNDSNNGVNILRSLIYPSKSVKMVPRLLNYFSFMASSAVLGTVKLPESDYIMVESPPLFLGLTGVYLAKLKGAKLIFNVSDLWPESAAQLGAISRESLPFRLSNELEKFLYEQAWLVTGQSKGILADINQRYPNVRTYHLSNGADTSRFGKHLATPEARRKLTYGYKGGFVVLYAGLHGIAQGLDQILDVADKCRRHPVLKTKNIRFVLVGDGPEKKRLRERAEQMGLMSVTFLDPVPSKDVPALLASADALIVTLKQDIPGAVPSKIYESMATERPLIAVADGEAADIIKSREAGLVVKPNDLDGLVDALMQCTDHTEEGKARMDAMTERARQAAVQDFDRNLIAQKWLEFLG